MTKMERQAAFLFKWLALVVLANIKSIPLVCRRFYSTADEQRKLYDQKKSNCDGYTKISKHQLWLAVDLYILTDNGQDIIFDDPRYKTLGELAGKLGLTWGGQWYEEGKTKFNDLYHFELSD